MPSHRDLLYISPHFPPHAKVGALRPLKFIRHLPDFGWRAAVFCDYHPSNTLDYRLVEAIPPGAEIVRTYGWWSGQEASARGTASGTAPHVRHPDAEIPSEHRTDPMVDIPHAVFRGSQLMRQKRYDAILVNGGPWAAFWVGKMLSKRFDVPLVCDLRDPWSICELRRPMRTRMAGILVDRAEHSVFETASRVILNNETTGEGYLKAYAGTSVPASKFTVIRNHADPELSRLMPWDGSFDRYTALFLGTFRRFVLGENLLAALARLPALGVLPGTFQVALPAQAYNACRKQAETQGVLGYLKEIPFIPNTQSGHVMDRADLLVSISNASSQRIPAKVYEYLLTDRPILSVAPPHPELESMLGEEPAAMHVDLDDVEGLTQALAKAYRRGRDTKVQHKPIDDSRKATAKLARLLDALAG